MRSGWLSGISVVLVLAMVASPPLCAAATCPVQSQSTHIAPDSSKNLNADRQAIMNRLEKLGTPQRQAAESVALLNQDDLATLANNPRMIQRAGDADSITREVFWGCVALGGVALLIGLLAD